MFLMKDYPGKDVDLHRRILNEYEEGKAFRLFEVEYNGVSLDSDYCFMKARCTHSVSMNDVPRTSWVCAAKKSGEICQCILHLCCRVSTVLLLWCFVLNYVVFCHSQGLSCL